MAVGWLVVEDIADSFNFGALPPLAPMLGAESSSVC